MRLFLYFFVVSALVAPAICAARDAGVAVEDASRSIETLIGELGDDDYAVRRRAEEQLLRLGLDAYDQLKAAESHRDLEIAERVRYIVLRMRIQWMRAEDPPDVRRLLGRYADLSEIERNARIRQLAELDDRAGIGALCRIARFDPSPVLARRAALAVAVAQAEISQQDRDARLNQWLAELGSSDRAPARWTRLALQPGQGDDAERGWLAEIDAETRLLTEDSPETEFAIVQLLLNWRLEQCADAGNADDIVPMLERCIAVIDEQLGLCHDAEYDESVRDTLYGLIKWNVAYDEKDSRVAALTWALQWVLNKRKWDVVGPLEDQFADNLRTNRKLLYHLAAATGRAGRRERAEEIAERAYALSADDGDQRVEIAGSVAEYGFIEWAEREYRWTIEKYPVVDFRSMFARTGLAMWMQDRDEFQQAADLVGEFCDAVNAKGGDDAELVRLMEELERRVESAGEALQHLKGRRLFYMACVAEQQKDYETQRARLLEAAALDGTDPDILIAMYRSPGASEDFRQSVRARIRDAAKKTQAEIDESPNHPTYYNQWAWLIANTEGDQQRAVEYSQKSLELAPDEPSYLDTLGRCYYAVGEYAKAVESQRRAVELAPHYRVMQRQLAQFEQALAEQKAAP